ncbi:glycine oxidase [Nitrosomonas sp. PY1]|uniref:glycine oxidase ThiO n=1 Tax=Nitrosomonas sp. PY1 TaxID=1803906 RepID=UPI001FC7E0A4|nr:glycine oxidase ThiO [Nitrosomonas sp. PY1]GKS70310.1 glycine oxidase [Nitrosomonas sp. PY1]
MKQDIVIIGAGVIGLATAEKLLSQGARVTLIERNEIGLESSWAGGGILSPLCPWDYSDDVNRLSRYSAQLFPQWASKLYKTSGIDPEYLVSGIRILSFVDKKTIEGWLLQYPTKIQYLTASHTDIHLNKKHIPSNHRDQENNSSILMPDIAQVRNPRLLKSLHMSVLRLGGKIIKNCAVNQINIRNHNVSSLTTAQGQIFADYYVVSAGAWSKALLGSYALGIDIKPIKGQMLLFKFNEPPITNILIKNDVYMIPRQDGHLLVGSTIEDVGFNKEITITARNSLMKKACEILPLLDKMPIIKQWAGLRPATKKNSPYIGRHSALSNLFMNAGHFRYGILMAPASAEILANEITNHAQKIDINPYQPGSISQTELQ